MNRRRIGIGWTLALLALLGHVAGADCCLIRGAVGKALETASAAAHACCEGGVQDAGAPASGDEGPVPDCCGVTCAPVAALEAPLAFAAPSTTPAGAVPVAVTAPGAPEAAPASFVAETAGPPAERAPRAARGRAPPIA